MTSSQSIKPFDEQYLLVDKRNILASNLALASLANYVSLVTGKPVGQIITGVGVESRKLAEKFTEEEIDSHIQTILDSYDYESNNIPINNAVRRRVYFDSQAAILGWQYSYGINGKICFSY